MWTWVGGIEARQLAGMAIEVAGVRGGCWITSDTETVPRALLTTTCRLPFVGLRMAVEI
jgi:hypothetical protein